ncbi:MAG: tryptophan 2,3-dioxygenase [Longimicrobiaceae bacterium]
MSKKPQAVRFGLAEKRAEKLNYGGYLKVPELVALQELRSDPPRHDETLFIIIHQTYELWFKQILHELDEVVARLGRDDVLGAHQLLRRSVEIERVLIQQIDVLETMTPVDFLAFRDHLRPASGFQSAQFREIEFLAGLRDASYLDSFRAGSTEYARLSERLAAPSLGAGFYALLRRRGFDLPEGAAQTKPGERAAGELRLAELVRLYREQDQHHDLFLLAEGLVDFDELFSLWRLRHVKMVERVIGPVPGTGGSEGAGYLWKTVDKKFFPELWEVRGRLSESAADRPAQ